MDKEIQTFGRQEQLFAGNGESTDLALMVDALAQEERSPGRALAVGREPHPRRADGRGGRRPRDGGEHRA